MASAFQCLKCGSTDTDVKDSRATMVAAHTAVRRRRRCKQCKLSFSTLEVREEDVRRADRVILFGDKLVVAARDFAADVEKKLTVMR